MRKKYFDAQSDDEVVLLLLRRHWFTLFNAGLITFLMYFFGLVSVMVLPMMFPSINKGFSDNLYVLVNSLLFLFGTTNFFSSVAFYYLNVGIITNENIVQINQARFFSRQISELELDKIQDVSSSQKGIMQNFLNFGNIEVQTAGKLPNFSFTNVGNASENARKIMEMAEQYRGRGHRLKKENSVKDVDMLK